jgi:hypothetical protein
MRSSLLIKISSKRDETVATVSLTKAKNLHPPLGTFILQRSRPSLADTILTSSSFRSNGYGGGSNNYSTNGYGGSNGYSNGYGSGNTGYGGASGGYGGGGDKMSNLGAGLKVQHWGTEHSHIFCLNTMLTSYLRHGHSPQIRQIILQGRPQGH